MKRVGKFAVAVALQPIIVAKARADLLDRGANRLLQVCEREVDWGYSGAGADTPLTASVAWMER
jgi:hypothetical protein